MNQQDAEKEKQKQAELKALREELSKQISDQLSSELMEEERSSAEAASQPCEITDDQEAKRILEAVLFTSGKPVMMSDLKRVVKGYAPGKIEALIRELEAEYVRDHRSFRIMEIAGGYECSTDPKYAPWILKMELQRKAKQATKSALETLAILAYKQPVTRAEIEDLRGVDVSGVMSTLLDRGLIKIVGRKEIPGRPFLYGTTEKFLEHFGLKSLQELPNISEIQSLVENSVKRDELLRTAKVISAEETAGTVQADVPQEEKPSAEEPAAEAEPVTQPDGGGQVPS